MHITSLWFLQLILIIAAISGTFGLLLSFHDFFYPVSLLDLFIGELCFILHLVIHGFCLPRNLDLIVFDLVVFPLGRLIKLLVPNLWVSLSYNAVVYLVV